MYFFNYFFYRMSGLLQDSKLEEKHPEASAGAVVPLFQMFNLMTILILLFNIKMTVPLVLYTWGPTIIISWIFFFNRKKLDKYREKWDDEDSKRRHLKGVLIIVYMIVSVTLFGYALGQQ